MRSLSTGLLVLVLAGPVCVAAEEAKFLLVPEISEGDTTRVQVTLEVGGDLLVSEEASGETKKLPLTVAGELNYIEHLLTWSADANELTRAWREYQSATAKIQVEKSGVHQDLPGQRRSVIAEIRGGRAVLDGAEQRLTRDQFDLINVVGNSLSLNHLLPGRELSEGDDWDHEADEIAALLGMDNVAVCEVRSVVTGSEHQQVQIRMAGTVHGTIDGAPTEIEVRGAYLFHQKLKRVTKFNLAIKESRTASAIVPGLDIVAKVSLTVVPDEEELSSDISERARDIAEPLETMLSYEALQQGYRFLHDRAWYVTSEASDLISLRSLHNGNQTSHCNVTTLPARSAGRQTTLEQFERDVRESLGARLETVTASTGWKTLQGHDCLGVVAQGKVEQVPIEWRYYLVSAPNLPRISIAVTLKQSVVQQFNDADRQIVDSLELLPSKAKSTAARESSKQNR